MSLLEQDTTKKEWMDDKNAAELDTDNKGGEYEVEGIRNSAVYTKEADRHLPRLYYLIT